MFETLDKALSSVQLVQSYNLVHAQRPGTTVPQTPTYWAVNIGLVDGYNGLNASLIILANPKPIPLRISIDAHFGANL